MLSSVLEFQQPQAPQFEPTPTNRHKFIEELLAFCISIRRMRLVSTVRATD